MKVTRKVTFKTDQICVGDQITVKLTGFGKFTATAQRVTDKGILFLFDEVIAKHQMNGRDTNDGAFENSDMNRWLHDTVLPAFPEKLRYMVKDISLPTYGEIFGYDYEKGFYKNFEPDTDEQFELMKRRGNRVCDFNNDLWWWWLRNATQKEVSSAYFACVDFNGLPACSGASYSCGVRPEFLVDR